MKTRLYAIATVMSAIMCCQADGVQLLNRMMDRGCGCDGGAAVASSCCDTPSSCCGRGLHFSVDLKLQLPRLNRGGRGCGGCDSGCDTGCGAAAPASTGCGCDTASSSSCCGRSGLLSGLSGFNLFNRGGNGCGGCDSGCDTGCDTAAPASAGCGCDAAPAADCCDPCARGGRVRSLLGRVRSLGNCGGCDSGCGCDTGCAAAPASAGCGCDNGCGAAPASAGCGCDAAPRGCGSRQVCINLPSLGLMDRLRSLGCNRGCGGCDSGCDSGCGAVVSNGCGCNGSPATPAAGAPATTVEPVPSTQTPPAATDGAQNQIPVVDPNAFIIRGAGYRGK